MNIGCSFEPRKGGGTGFDEWIKATPVQEIQENPRLAPTSLREIRLARTTKRLERDGGSQRMNDTKETPR